MRDSNSLVLGGKTLIFQDCKIESLMNNSEALAVTDIVCSTLRKPEIVVLISSAQLNSPKSPFAQAPQWAPQWLFVGTNSSPPSLDVAL